MTYKIKDILIWLGIFIIGSLIVSFLIYPSSFQLFKSNVKSILPSSSDVKISSISQVDSSLLSCQNEIKEKSRIAEEKSPLTLNIDIREYKEFDNSLSALQYLEEWDLVGYELFNNDIHGGEQNIDLNKDEDIKKIIEYDNIIIFLVRFEYSREEDSVKILKPIICIDGKLSEESKSRFVFSIYG